MKKAFKLGLIGGFFVGILVAIAMDFAFKDALGGSWADAVRHDLSQILGRPITNNSILVIAGVVLIVGLVGTFFSFLQLAFAKYFQECKVVVDKILKIQLVTFMA